MNVLQFLGSFLVCSPCTANSQGDSAMKYKRAKERSRAAKKI